MTSNSVQRKAFSYCAASPGLEGKMDLQVELRMVIILANALSVESISTYKPVAIVITSGSGSPCSRPSIIC